MGWRIFAAAVNGDAHATVYLTPEGRVCLRAQEGRELLCEVFVPRIEDVALEAAFSELPQPLYEALLDALARRSASG
ncbi:MULTISPECIES: hypothetical protein [Deinococcus]|uniref:Uncharacterized protein n=1 Tax=Deinococcus ruber TaxID=1848197 RepID=A0A918C190_9DEIO|nr:MULTISPECIES: hypothetical protein [Deinococcus]ULH14643.1 hypothetical protein MF271_11555 [Deinococcus sp. KNUC1210]GGR02121.1 hypothetical protein GCM10008957_13790 [Deinococcus ruber]